MDIITHPGFWTGFAITTLAWIILREHLISRQIEKIAQAARQRPVNRSGRKITKCCKNDAFLYLIEMPEDRAFHTAGGKYLSARAPLCCIWCGWDEADEPAPQESSHFGPKPVGDPMYQVSVTTMDSAEPQYIHPGSEKDCKVCWQQWKDKHIRVVLR